LNKNSEASNPGCKYVNLTLTVNLSVKSDCLIRMLIQEHVTLGEIRFCVMVCVKWECVCVNKPDLIDKSLFKTRQWQLQRCAICDCIQI